VSDHRANADLHPSLGLSLSKISVRLDSLAPPKCDTLVLLITANVVRQYCSAAFSSRVVVRRSGPPISFSGTCLSGLSQRSNLDQTFQPKSGSGWTFCSASVATHAPPSIHGPSHSLPIPGRAVAYTSHRCLYSKIRHPTRHSCKTILPRTLHRRSRRRSRRWARQFHHRMRIGC
jgi:hypothetical protein